MKVILDGNTRLLRRIYLEKYKLNQLKPKLMNLLDSMITLFDEILMSQHISFKISKKIEYL